MLSNSQIARLGEEAAVSHLKKLGYRVLERNVDLPMGELDIVAQKRGRFVFIEVKTSIETPRSFFHPEERVDKRKRRTLQSLCETYLIRRNADPNCEWQIDVVAVLLDKEGKIRSIQHIENAVWETRQ